MDDDRSAIPRAGKVTGHAHEAWRTITLTYDARHRRRGMMRTDTGEPFLLDLPEAAELRGGDALVLEDGRQVRILAAAEPLTEVRATDARHLARLAWHLGNRHLQVQFGDERLLIKRDHVVEAMLAGLGARLAPVEAPFDPEGGAYAHGHAPAAGAPHEHG
jgi:urease accessory protein